MAKQIYLTAREAAEELGISRATLYAYVSRGLVRSEAVSGKQRERRYRAEDIQRLKERQDLRQNPAKTTEQALSWGIPVLESGLTFISNGRLFYRGQDVVELARNRSLEEVASLLWTGDYGPVLIKESSFHFSSVAPLSFSQESLPAIQALQATLLQVEAQDPAAYDLRPESVTRKGFWILRWLAETATQKPSQGKGVAESLQEAWIPSHPELRELISAALILLADHELNVSAFTARCVASAGSSPYAVVVAALSALEGVKHGGVTRRVEALFQEVDNPSRARAVLSERLKRGEAIPGFGHRLYPEGDPRAKFLLDQLREVVPAARLELADAIAEQAGQLIGELPTVDFGLVCLQRALELPEEAGILLFALGRTVGWIAHAIEQYQVSSIIRPRARYTGLPPDGG